MAEQLHVHIPWRMLGGSLPFLLEQRLQPEIAFKSEDLEALHPQEVARAGAQLAAAGLAVTVHAPFMDLNPGALDRLVREATFKRFEQTLDAAAALGARLVVFHPGFDRWRYGEQSQLWVEANLSFWPPFLRRAEGLNCLLTLENIFEVEPQTLVQLLDAIDSPWLGHCFDVGHWNMFAQGTLEAWFAALGGHTRHLHLHDNHGGRDEHLPVGEGEIDFAGLFRLLRALPVPPSLTLEAHDRPALQRSLAAVAPFLGR